MVSLFERRVRRAINHHREDHDLEPVSFDRQANQAARSWARYLQETGLFVHQDMQRVLRITHARTAGEMLARGSVSAGQFGQMWLASPTHCRVMLNPRYTGVGIAAVPTPHGRLVVVNLIRR